MARPVEEMIASWERIASGASTYNLTLDDWLNDLDLRDVIARRLAESQSVDGRLRERLESADRAFREATAEARQSLWGPTAGAEHRSSTHWWYFRYPSSPGEEMRRDLRAAGILPREAGR
jgi:hypothetical protein